MGPMGAFARAPTADSSDAGVGSYEVIVLALDKRPFTSEAGLVMHPHTCLDPRPWSHSPQGQTKAVR